MKPRSEGCRRRKGEKSRVGGFGRVCRCCVRSVKAEERGREDTEGHTDTGDFDIPAAFGRIVPAAPDRNVFVLKA